MGVLKALAAANQARWDIFCGTSVGAINAALLAQHRDSAEGVAALERVWATIDTGSVYRPWTFGYLQGFLGGDALLDSRPLTQLVHTYFDRKGLLTSGKKLRVVAASLCTYQSRVWHEQSEDIERAIVASAAFPLMFSPVAMDSETWIDGGVRCATPLDAAFKADVTAIDVILTFTRGASVHKTAPGGIVDKATRTLEILIDEVQQSDLALAEVYNDLASRGFGTPKGKRFVPIRIYEPDCPLPGSPLSFARSDIAEMQRLGFEAANKELARWRL